MPSVRSGWPFWIWALANLLGPTPAGRAQEAVRLREDFFPGYKYHVSCRTEVSGSLTPPPGKDLAEPKPLPLNGFSVIEYDERVLNRGTDGQVQKTFRICRKMDFQRKVGNQPQQSSLRPAVRRLVVLRLQNAEVPFSPDGPLTWGEIDLVRTDVFTPALTGLLPDRAVRPGDRWPAGAAAVQELTDLERVEEGQIECRFEQVTVVERRRFARIALSGTVRGVNEDGPSRQKLDGYFLFDLESQHLSYLSLRGVNALLDKDGKEVGTVLGQFVLSRQAHQRHADLSDEALRGVVLEPNDENTQLLYDNPDLGVRFLHPRRWRVAGVRGQQVALDEAKGSGLLLTLEAAGKAPTGAQFLAESTDWLQKQKARVFRTEQPRRLQAPPQELEHFAIDAEVMGQRALLDYYVIRQAAGGATIAARLLTDDLAALRKEVERIARSIVVSKR
jgi:hypothetical protein